VDDILESQLPNNNIIAIDGTSGSGKSTVARGLGTLLELNVLETGAYYRAATLQCLRMGLDPDNAEQALSAVEGMKFSYEGTPRLDGIDISDDIKSHDVVMNVSFISAHAQVRKILTRMMREWIVDHGGGVIEGRDITSVVTPHAKVRVFIDAPHEVRAKRRSSDPKDNINNLSHSEIAEGIALRDSIDSTRSVAPLIKADGVWEFDSSEFSPQEIIAEIARAFKA
jgi:cytidylate kinase